MTRRLLALTLFLLLLLLLPLLPASLLTSVTFYNAARTAQGVVLLTMLLSVPWWRAGSSSLTWPWALLLVLAAASCLMADKPGIALRDGIWTSAWLLSLGALFGALQSPVARDRALAAIAAGQFTYVLLASAVMLCGLLVEQLTSFWDAFPGYENPRYFNHTQTMSLPLLAAYSLWRPAPRNWRRLAAAAVVLNVFLICVFLARATVVSVVAAALLVSLGLRETRLLKALLLYAAFGSLLYVIGLKVLPHLLGISDVPDFRDPGERGSIEARLYLWQIALHAIREHPWLGLGPLHFAHTLNGEAAHPHNIYLQVAAEYGLPFALFAIALLARWLRQRFLQLREGARTSDAGIELGCFIGIVGALIDGLFSGNFAMPLSQSWFALCVGLLLALQRGRCTPAATRPFTASQQWAARVAGFGLVCGLMAILVSMTHELAQPEVNLFHGPSLRPSTNNPRFWLDGWF